MPRGQPEPGAIHKPPHFRCRVNKRAKWVALQSAHTIFQPDSGPDVPFVSWIGKREEALRMLKSRP
jgi:hypothetical protein